MCLTLSSNQSLQQLEMLARDQFIKIKNKEVTVPNLVKPMPYTKLNCKKFVKYIPHINAEVLTISW